MARRRLLSSSTRELFFGIPSDTLSLEQFYVLGEDDLDLVHSRRRQENQLGLAIHLALLRHPGQGWYNSTELPEAVVHWLCEQIRVSPSVLSNYGMREATQTMHRNQAMQHLGLRAFTQTGFDTALEYATKAAFGTDDGRTIMALLLEDIRKAQLVLPSVDTLERIGIAGRARARRLSAQALNDDLSESQKVTLNCLLKNDTSLGLSRLAWLRGMPHSTSVASMLALLERLTFVRSLELPSALGQNIHPDRLKKFAREGMVAPTQLLSDFGERRRIATLAAQLAELNIVLTDASIATFERLTGQLFTRSKRKQDLTWQTKQSQVGRLMRLFGGTIDAMELARENGKDPFEALDEMIGWERLIKSRPEIDALGDMATQDPLFLASKRYTQLRKFAPAFLKAFTFNVPQAGADLNAALELLKEHNSTGKRKLPDIVPMPFSAKHWKPLIFEDGKPKRRVYETAVIATLRDRLRAGDAWVEGSRDYRPFDAYLVPKSEAVKIMDKAGLQTNKWAWLTERKDLLRRRLHEVEHKLVRGQLEGVRIEKGELKITPHEPVTPPEAEQLDRAIDAIMPRIQITDLLWDVVNKTSFLDAFTDLRSGRPHPNPTAVLASILAGATNLGLERMALASKDLTHAQLSWASAWNLRPETYTDALARIIDAHHNLPFSQVWGTAQHTSSDAQFFASGRNSGEINAKYGPDPGLKIYSFLSGQYGSFNSNVIGATSGEAPFVLDGLVGNAAQFNPLVHYVDTGGVSDHVFALFYLLGLSLAPRLRDFPHRRLACFGKANEWKGLALIMGKPINEDVIMGHWDDAIRLAASAKNGTVKPSAMLKKLGAYRQQNRLYLALSEIGRIERTLFMLDWMENPKLRMECQGGLNKGEARHSLATAIFAHSQGRIRDLSPAAQQKRAMALNLVIAATVYWNTQYMDKATKHLQRAGKLPNCRASTTLSGCVNHLGRF
ncbi:Tn3 family transposase [Kiloniella sp.]|uniref:Tn3 family transposase n=1 Tax=Kiloniella sp. TaxID=1938587 RepID=UPI003B02D9F7